MAVPDKVYFGECPFNHKGVDYGFIRNLTDENDKLKYLKARLDTLMIKQFKSIIPNTSDSQTYCPFGLSILTSVSIETIGSMILDYDKISKENESSKKFACEIYSLMDKKLSHKPSKTFKKQLKSFHGNIKDENIENYGSVIHKFHRNTFTHSYQARGVFLDTSAEYSWQIGDGYLIINPYKFWELFEDTYNKIFHLIFEGKDKSSLIMRRNALLYFERLIK